MRLPKGASYKLLSTRNASFDSLIKELKEENFSGYIRLSVEGEKGIEDGYLLLKNGLVIGGEYQGVQTSFSKEAVEEIKKAWKTEGIIDIYIFSDFQLQLSIEENQDTLLAPLTGEENELAMKKSKTTVKPSKPITALEEREVHIEKPPTITPDIVERKIEPEITEIPKIEENSVAEDIIKKRQERMTLLKKFGLKEPQDDFVDAILGTLKLPSEKELNNKSRELKKEILQRLKQKTELEELDLYINSAKTGSAVEFNIDVYVKPFNKKIEKEVKSTIEDTLKEKLTFPYQKGLTINAA